MVKDKIWTKEYTTLSITNGLIFFAVQMITPAIPLFIVALGGTETDVGMVATSFFITSTITRFLVNVMLVHVERRRVLLMGVLLNVVVMFAFGYSSSIGVTAVLRILQGMGFGIITTLSTAMAADILPDSRRGEGIGYFGMMVVLAMTAGPILSLPIMRNHGFKAMFFTASAITLLPTIAVCLMKEPKKSVELESAEQQATEAIKTTEITEATEATETTGMTATTEAPETSDKPAKRAFWHNFFDPRLTILAALVALLGICRTADMNFISTFAEQRDMGAYLAMYFAIQTSSSFVIRFVMGRIVDKKGRSWVLVPGAFLKITALLMLSFTSTKEFMLLASAINGLGIGLIVPGMQLWLFDVAGPEKRNIASATYFSFYDIGISVGALLFGYLAEYVGYSFMFRTAASSAALYLICYAFVGRQRSVRAKG